MVVLISAYAVSWLWPAGAPLLAVCARLIVGLLSLQSTGSREDRLQQLHRVSSVVVAHRLSYPVACGIFPGQGSNPCSLHRWADLTTGPPGIS